MPAKIRRCIIIPAFEEEANIGTVVCGIRYCSDADIIVVDDGSRDATAQRASSAGARVIRHAYNMGYGAALQTGYKYALKNRYDVVVQMDGDGQHIPQDVGAMFSQVEDGRCDVAIGSRFLAPGGYDVGVLKSMGMGLFRGVVRLLTGLKITDPTSGFQCLSRKVFVFLTDDIFPCDYPDANIIILLHRMGYSICEVPVTMELNPQGKSMHKGVLKKLYYLFKVFLAIFITLIRIRPHAGEEC